MQLLLNTEMEQKDNNNFFREKRVKYTPSSSDGKNAEYI